jgi:hypothetical protein
MDFNVEPRFANNRVIDNSSQRRNLIRGQTSTQEPSQRNAVDLKIDKLSKIKSFYQTKKKAIKMSKEEYYEQERRVRPVYQDAELHSLMVSVVICLLLQPQRGTLDELYCH